ncbi:pyridoxal-dependent decarboxylase domain-containing protein 1-like isoform X2 [Bolinopsis microptera]|uniref:pyridoxal-dependent decarboxylase domain-containing protein 1-like isoform X2 n=1 Tax=Bolinopsis microptera TaxID=2820187 RepID=UPI0030795966
MNTLISSAFDHESENVLGLDAEPTVSESVVQKLNFDEESMNDEVRTMATETHSIDSHELETDPVLETTSMSTNGNGEYQVVGNEETSGTVESGNMGILSDFSDQASTSSVSTPIAPEILGRMDEIQACMISLSDMEKKSSAATTSTTKNDISNSEDLSIILKRIVLLCDSADRRHLEAQCMNQVCAVWCMHDLGTRRCQDVLYASLRGLSSYIDSATDSTLLSNQIQTEIRHWLTSIIRLPDYTPNIFESPVEAVISLTESLLFSNFPTMAEDGLFALYAKYPVIYMSPDDVEIYSRQILSRFYLPKSVISVVPYSLSSPNSRTLDIKAFERIISDDISCGKLPLLAITTVGTKVTGHIDNIPAIKYMCDKHGIWLHAKGSCSPLLSLDTPPATVKVFEECDSVSVSCDTLLCDTFIQTSVLFINSESDHVTNTPKLEVELPLWVLLQHQGSSKIISQIQNSYNLAVQLYNELKSIESIQLLEYPLTGHVLCFRYYSLLENIPDLAEQDPMNNLMSKLTLMMYETLEQQFGSDKLQLIELSGELNVIRLAPLDKSSLTLDDMPLLLSTIREEVTKYETSLGLRETLNLQIQSRDNFLLVIDPLHPSVGAFQYLPKYLQDEEACNTLEGGEELNEINEKLCQYLGDRWPVIATRQVAKFTVISIPLVSETIDVRALLDDIVRTAPKFENNSKYLARMSEIIMRGIDLANEELQLESEQQFYEKGIIRNIPIFGPVFNWMSPIEDKIIVGRSFSLHSGEVEATDTVFSVAGTPARSRTTSTSSYVHDPQV